MGSCVFVVLFMSLWHLSEVLVGNGCVHNGFCLSSPLIMLSLFLSLVVALRFLVFVSPEACGNKELLAQVK